MLEPRASFKENLALLPSIDGITRIDLIDAQDVVVAQIENAPGKQGSLAVYQYLHQQFGALNADAAAHGVAMFGEHSADAKARPGAHPNIDRLFGILDGDEPLTIAVVAA